MKTLYLDSTYNITFGLLDEKFEWLKWCNLVEKKAATFLHSRLHGMMQELALDWKDIDRVICTAGPGFYTGMRVSQGFASLLSLSGKSIFSFYSYSIPRLIGFQDYVWLTKAYRGEFFSYQALGESGLIELRNEQELGEYISKINKQIFIHSRSAWSETDHSLFKDVKCTADILIENPSLIFPAVVKNNLKSPTYYFRAPEDEFRVAST